jgi:trigger factor
MQITTESPDKTHIKLTISGEAKELADIKEHVLKELAQNIKNVPGFRKGKAPLAMVEKQINPDLLQTEFIEHAVNDLYGKAVTKEDMRVVGQPKIELTKFVPFDTLEFTAETEVIGKVKLGEYKNLKIKKTIVAVTEDDVNEVLSRLAARDAKKDEVTRAAKDGDEVIIDFTGTDTKTKEAIAGADGKEYPLIIGSNNFIPGFEPQLIGLKAGEEKSFDIVFPKDYGSKDLQSKKVTFAIKVHKVNSVTAPKLDDAFAAKVGPFKSISELRDDIKKQITAEREQSADREYENELVLAVAKKTTVALPETLVNEQLDRIQQDERQNLMYRGLTWEEFLKSEDLTEEKYRESHKEQAELRAKAGLALSEIADAEGITVEQAEFDAQLDALKQRYNDEEMRAQLTKPEGQREIVSRILTQKTLDRLKELNPAK